MIILRLLFPDAHLLQIVCAGFGPTCVGPHLAILIKKKVLSTLESERDTLVFPHRGFESDTYYHNAKTTTLAFRTKADPSFPFSDLYCHAGIDFLNTL